MRLSQKVFWFVRRRCRIFGINFYKVKLLYYLMGNISDFSEEDIIEGFKAILDFYKDTVLGENGIFMGRARLKCSYLEGVYRAKTGKDLPYQLKRQYNELSQLDWRLANQKQNFRDYLFH